jgi:UDP-glucose 4-epimerase
LNVLVTGGEGFIGSSLIKHLAEQDEVRRIYSIDNAFTSNKNNLVNSKKISYWRQPTKKINVIMNDKKIDVVFHFGEYSRIDPSFDDLAEVFEFNMRGTWEVINFCKRKKIPMIYSGSSSKFGSKNNEHLSPYAWTKSKNTEIIKNFAEWYGLQYNILYFHNVYGPGQIETGKYATVIGIFENQKKLGMPLTVVSPGTQNRDFTHVDDVVSGIWKCFKNAKPNTEYSLGTGINYSINEIAQAFECEIKMIPEKRGERHSSLANIKKAKKDLNWLPKINVLEYIKENYNVEIIR